MVIENTILTQSLTIRAMEKKTESESKYCISRRGWDSVTENTQLRGLFVFLFFSVADPSQLLFTAKPYINISPKKSSRLKWRFAEVSSHLSHGYNSIKFIHMVTQKLLLCLLTRLWLLIPSLNHIEWKYISSLSIIVLLW